MPKTFQEAYQIFRDMSEDGTLPPDMSFNRFAHLANKATQSDDFNPALETGWFGSQIKKGEYWLNRGLEATGIPQATGAAGRGVFEALGGSGDLGQQVGEGLPKGLLEMAPMIAFPEAALAKAATMGLMGASTYAETDSPLRGAISAATLPFMGMGGAALEKLAIKGGLLKPFQHLVPEFDVADNATGHVFTGKAIEGLGQKATQFAAHNVGAISVAEAINYATEAIANKTWNPYEGQSAWDRVLGATVGNFPYMLTGVPGMLKKGPSFIERPTKIKLPGGEEAASGGEAPVSAEDLQRSVIAIKFANERAKASQYRNKTQKKEAVARAEKAYYDNLAALDQLGAESLKPAEVTEQPTGGIPFDYGFPETAEKKRTFDVFEITPDADPNDPDTWKRYGWASSVEDAEAMLNEAAFHKRKLKIVETTPIDKEDLQTPEQLEAARQKTQANATPGKKDHTQDIPIVASALAQQGVSDAEALKQATAGANNTQTALQKQQAELEAIRKANAAKAGRQETDEQKASKAQTPADKEAKQQQKQSSNQQAVADILKNARATVEGGIARGQISGPKEDTKGSEFQGASGRTYRFKNNKYNQAGGEAEFAKIVLEGEKLLNAYRGDINAANASFLSWVKELSGHKVGRRDWVAEGTDPIVALQSKLHAQLVKEHQLGYKRFFGTDISTAEENPDVAIQRLNRESFVEVLADELDLPSHEKAALAEKIEKFGLHEGALIWSREKSAWLREHVTEMEKAAGQVSETFTTAQGIETIQVDKKGNRVARKQQKITDEELEDLKDRFSEEELKYLQEHADDLLDALGENEFFVEPRSEFDKRPEPTVKDGKWDNDVFFKVATKIASSKEINLWRKLVPEAFKADTVDVGLLTGKLESWVGTPKDFEALPPPREKVLRNALEIGDGGENGNLQALIGKSDKSQHRLIVNAWFKENPQTVEFLRRIGVDYVTVDENNVVREGGVEAPGDLWAERHERAPMFDFDTSKRMNEAPKEPIKFSPTPEQESEIKLALEGEEKPIKVEAKAAQVGDVIDAKEATDRYIDLSKAEDWGSSETIMQLCLDGYISVADVHQIGLFGKEGGFRAVKLAEILQDRGYDGILLPDGKALRFTLGEPGFHPPFHKLPELNKAEHRDFTLKDIEKIATRTGKIRVYFGSFDVKGLMSKQRRYVTGLQAAMDLAKTYEIPWMEFKKYVDPKLLEKDPNTIVAYSKAQAPEKSAKSRYGELVTRLNSLARVIAESKRTGVSVEDLMAVARRRAMREDVHFEEANAAEWLDLPDKLKANGRGLLSAEIDVRDLPMQLTDQARGILKDLQSNRFGAETTKKLKKKKITLEKANAIKLEQALYAWNKGNVEFQLNPQKLKDISYVGSKVKDEGPRDTYVPTSEESFADKVEADRRAEARRSKFVGSSGEEFALESSPVSERYYLPVDRNVQIPRSGSMAFAPEAFKGIEGFKSRSKIVELPIKDFLEAAAKLEDSVRRPEAEEAFEKGIKWSELPRLQVEGNEGVFKVVGHEGRNRAEALLKRGYETMPVEIRDWKLRWSETDPSQYPKELQSEDGKSVVKLPEITADKYEPKTGDLLKDAIGRGEVPERYLLSDEPKAQPAMLPNARQLFEANLRKTGFSEKEVERWGQVMEDVKDLFNIQGLSFYELINDVSGKPLMGLANMGKMREVFLSRGFTDADAITARELVMTLAHESGHIIDGMLSRGELPSQHAENLLAYKKFLQDKPIEAQKFLSLMREMMPKDYRDLPIWDEWQKSFDPKEMWANSMAMWASMRLKGEEGKVFGVHVAPEARGFLKTMGELVRRIWGAFKGIFVDKPKLGSDLFKGGIDELVKTFDELNASMRDSEFMFKDLQAMARLGSSDIFALKTSELELVNKKEDLAFAKARKETDRSRQGAFEKAWQYAVGTLHDLAMRIPAMNRLVACVMEHGPMSLALSNKSLAPLYGGWNASTGTVDTRGKAGKETKMFYKKANAPLNRLFSDIAQWAQTDAYSGGAITENSIMGSTNTKWMGKDLKDRIRAMNPEHKRMMFDLFARMGEVHKLIAHHTVESFKENGRNYMMLYGGYKLKDKYLDMPKIIRGITDALDNANSTDANVLQKGMMDMARFRQMIGDDATFDKMVIDWAETQADAAKLQAYFDEHPEHMSMIRVGKWKVNATHPEFGKYTDALPELKDTYERWKQDIKNMFKEMGHNPDETKFELPEEVTRGHYAKIDDTLLELVTASEEKWRSKVEALDLSELGDFGDAIKQTMLEGTNVSGDVARHLNARDVNIPGFMKGLPGGKRKVVPGSMDMLETQRIYATMAAKLNATRIMRSRMAYELANPELKKYPGEVEQLKKQVSNYLRPDSAFIRSLTKFNSQWFLAGNLPTHLLNLAQSFHTMLPEIVRQTGSLVKSTLITARAVKDIGSFTAQLLKENIGLDKDHTAVSKLVDPEERELFKWNIQRGYWNFSTMGDLTDHAMDAATDLTKLSQSGATESMAKKLTTPVRVLGDFTMKAFAATEHFNQRISTLIGFRLAREKMGKNYDREAAFEAARDFMRATTYAGGKINRPMMQGDLGFVGNLAYGLQGYTVGYLNHLGRYIRHWKGSEYLNLSNAERNNARKAALTMFGMMLGSAGVLGMPFVGAALKNYEDLTGTDVTSNALTGLADLLGEDAENGGGMANAIMYGAANGVLANSGLPVDLGSRWALNGIFGINPYDGFSGEAAFGPTSQIVSSALGGFKSAVSGDFGQAAISLSPAGIKKAVALLVNDGQIKTPAGKPIETTDFDKYAAAIGFTPQSVSRINQLNHFKKNSAASELAESKREATHFIDLLKWNPQEAQTELNRIAFKNQESPQKVAQRISKTITDNAFPHDYREDLQGHQKQHLADVARVLGVQVPSAPQQVMKQQYQAQIMMMLGQRPALPTPDAFFKDATAKPYSPFMSRRPSMIPGSP